MGKKVKTQPDPELKKVIEDLIHDSRLTWFGRWKRIVIWRKKNRGLTSVGITSYDPHKTNPEDVAKGMIKHLLRIADGAEEEDVTDETL